eukprot:3343648-Amphidinium_carterae.1
MSNTVYTNGGIDGAYVRFVGRMAAAENATNASEFTLGVLGPVTTLFQGMALGVETNLLT